MEKAEEKVVDDERICTFIGKLRSTFTDEGVTKRYRLSLLTNTCSALVIRVQMRVEGGVAGSRPMSFAVHIA